MERLKWMYHSSETWQIWNACCRRRRWSLWKCCPRNSELGTAATGWGLKHQQNVEQFSYGNRCGAMMRHRAKAFGPLVRQRKVNPEITIARAGTMPDYLYQKEVPVRVKTSDWLQRQSQSPPLSQTLTLDTPRILQHPWPCACSTWQYRVRWTKWIWVKQRRGNAWRHNNLPAD